MTISAKIIADSISPDSIRLVTVQCRYPKFIHGEVMTHRVFSRNASSSRAIPVERLIKDVIDDPVYPSFWGKNQPGMQANEECNALVAFTEWAGTRTYTREAPRMDAWLAARANAITMARAFADAGYHKQIVNRILEPFCHINTLITATEWSNFFALRCHKDAQPEMRILAENIRDAMAASTPTPLKHGGWHLPYVDPTHDAEEIKKKRLTGLASVVNNSVHKSLYIPTTVWLSVARSARVSYLTQEGKTPNIEDDLKLYDRLVGSVPLHASPCEHQATPDERWNPGPEWANPHLHGNLRGYIQYRKTLPGECQ